MGTNDETQTPAGEASPSTLKGVLAIFVIATIALLGVCVALVVDKEDNKTATEAEMTEYVMTVVEVTTMDTIFSTGENVCKDMNPKYPNVDCVHTTGPQAGANVTDGYVGGKNVSVVPNTDNYWQTAMCAVNVHWHLGTEHYSVGEYDEDGDGPHGTAELNLRRKLAGEDVRGGFRCHYYDEEDTKFTTEYDWKHCEGMEVGETYEVHWPHSAAGACGTVDQYQTPFYDGVFCNLPNGVAGLEAQQIASAVGVQAQIYTVVNDESYFYPDMMRGWIVDGDYGSDIAYYTGSTTGTSRDNEICSAYAPITWQVDRKCHLISASSFDKLCYDMKNQRDDMHDDLHAHGSRELVSDHLVANNQQRQLKKMAKKVEMEQRKLHLDDHHHHHGMDDHHHHDSDHHHHHEWY
jgi:hypothetical protein